MEKELYEQILQELVNKCDGISDETWGDIIDKYELNIHSDSLRKAFATTEFSGYKIYKHMIDKARDSYSKEDMNKLIEKEYEVMKKAKKANTLYSFVHKQARLEGRADMWHERIVGAIEGLSPVVLPNIKPVVHNDVEGVLSFSDFHFGDNIAIKGLNGESINLYNENEFKTRMWHLMEDTIDIVKKEKLTTLHAMALSDYIEGLIHFGQLGSLEHGVVDSVIRFSEIMAQWLNELSGYVNVIYHQCNDGNHDELRLITNKKGDLPNENVGKLIYEFIKVRLRENDNITLSQSKDGYIYENIKGVNFFGYHGEDKNQEKALVDLEKFYGIKIDIMLSGHLHHGSLIGCGKGTYGDVQCIRVPSVCGTNAFAKRIKRDSSAGAMLFIVEEGKGKVCSYDIWLN